MPSDHQSGPPDAPHLVVNPTAADDEAAARAGLPVRRDLLQLRRPLPLSADELALVATTPTRRFVPGSPDETAWIELNNRAFAAHPDQSGFDPQRLHALLAEPWFDPDGFRLHHRRGRLVAFCWTKVHPAEPTRGEPALGEIFVIGVDPELHGTGLGRRLTLAGLAWLADHGLDVGMLYVDATNTPARMLYDRLGFTTHHIERIYLAQEPPTPSSDPTP